MTIRVAVNADIPEIVVMGSRFIAEEYSGKLTNNPVQMAALVEQLIDGPNSIVYVADQDGYAIGMIGLVYFPNHVSAEPTVGEVFWWMEPEFRGRGLKLMKTAEQWAVSMGATRLQMIAPSQRTGQLYERLGYELTEMTYQKAIG